MSGFEPVQEVGQIKVLIFQVFKNIPRNRNEILKFCKNQCHFMLNKIPEKSVDTLNYSLRIAYLSETASMIFFAFFSFFNDYICNKQFLYKANIISSL